jgi:hypothetical protein
MEPSARSGFFLAKSVLQYWGLEKFQQGLTMQNEVRSNTVGKNWQIFFGEFYFILFYFILFEFLF